MQNTNPENKTHEKAAYVGEVVKTGEKTENKGDYHVEHDEGKVFPGRAAFAPGVEEIEQRERDDAEEGA